MKSFRLTYGFRFKSVLVQTFFWIVLLVIVLTSIFSYYAVKVATDNLQEKTYSSRLNMLNNTSNAVEITLESLSQLMRQTMQNSYCISAMIVPDNTEYERTTNITNQLKDIATGYPLVKKAILYIPTDNTLYSSDILFINAAESKDYPLIETYFDADVPETILKGTNNLSTRIKLMGERVILYQNFFPDYLKQIGVLIFEIDADYLFKMFLADISDKHNTTYVFDKNGLLVFTKEGGAPITDVQFSELHEQAEPSGFYTVKDNTDQDIVVFYHVSALTDWVYCNPVAATELQSKILYMQDVFFLPIILFIGFLISVYIAYRLYTPIRLLVDSIIKYEGKGYIDISKQQAKNELDLFELAYTNTNLKNEQLSQTLELIKPAVIERLFSNIMFDRETSRERIEETLSSLGDPIPYEAHYIVLIASIENSMDMQVSEYDMGIFTMRMQGIVADSIKTDIYHAVLRLSDQSVAAVLVFSPEKPLLDVKHGIARLYEAISEKLCDPPHKVVIGFSNVYRYITDLRYCYLEALENLNRKFFYGESGDGAQAAENITDEFAECVKRIILCFNKDDMKRAALLSKQVCSEISRTADAQEVFNNFATLIEITCEKLIAMKLGSAEDVFEAKSDIEKSLKDCSDVKGMEECVNQFFTKLINDIENRNKTKKFQNLRRIREFIEENYSNRDMSLEMAAGHVGISPTYLSRLFKEEMGMPFVDYLNQIRIEKAKQLLTNTDISISDIGYQAGFNSMQTFFRVFRKFTAISPGNYRQTMK